MTANSNYSKVQREKQFVAVQQKRGRLLKENDNYYNLSHVHINEAQLNTWVLKEAKLYSNKLKITTYKPPYHRKNNFVYFQI